LFGETFVRQEYYFKAARDDPLILDCGANLGFSMLYFKYMYPRARITCFEPFEGARAILAKNIEKNHLKDVEIVPLALAGKKGSITFYYDAAGMGGNTVLPGRIQNALSTTVQTGILSEFVKKAGTVDFVKMDIEGSENAVMQELDKSCTLRNIREMVIEYHHCIVGKAPELSAFLAILERNGFDYRLRSVYSQFSSWKVTQNVMIHAKSPQEPAHGR
jgi:FkbM family methyltransferase